MPFWDFIARWKYLFCLVCCGYEYYLFGRALPECWQLHELPHREDHGRYRQQCCR